MNEDLLQKRLKYFLSTDKRNRQEVRNLIKTLERHGLQVVIFGGMLRDLLLVGNRKFNSDVDLVVNGDEKTFNDLIINTYNGKKNRFYGYKMSLNNWKVDAFLLDHAWAKIKGYVNVSDFNDLVNVTFFTSDAIIYNTTTTEIYTGDKYFENLSNRVLDINLKECINPVGQFIRAHKYREKFGFEFSENLNIFLKEVIDKYGIEYLISEEKNNFGTSYIKNGA